MSTRKPLCSQNQTIGHKHSSYESQFPMVDEVTRGSKVSFNRCHSARIAMRSIYEDRELSRFPERAYLCKINMRGKVSLKLVEPLGCRSHLVNQPRATKSNLHASNLRASVYLSITLRSFRFSEFRSPPPKTLHILSSTLTLQIQQELGDVHSAAFLAALARLTCWRHNEIHRRGRRTDDE